MKDLKEKKEVKDKGEVLPLMNEKIKSPVVQLITDSGENIGLVKREEALFKAMQVGLDLVLINEKAGQPPIVKIMDFGKVLYERKQKKKESKKHQKVIQVKEIKMRPKIGEHDYMTKMKQMMQFLKDGKRVKVTLAFRGRENAMKDQLGNEFFEKIDKTMQDFDLAKNVVQEKDSKLGQFWSRIYFLKSTK